MDIGNNVVMASKWWGQDRGKQRGMRMEEIGTICNRDYNKKGSWTAWHGSVVGCGPMNQGISGLIPGQGT